MTTTEGGRLGELYEAHAPDAARLAYLLTGDRALAEDLVHEAFVRLFGRFRDLRNPDAFGAYLDREGRAPDAAPVDPGGREELWQALQQLRPRQRAAIVLRYYEDLTEAQTADVLGCARGTVKSLVSRGIDRLRQELRGSE